MVRASARIQGRLQHGRNLTFTRLPCLLAAVGGLSFFQPGGFPANIQSKNTTRPFMAVLSGIRTTGRASLNKNKNADNDGNIRAATPHRRDRMQGGHDGGNPCAPSRRRGTTVHVEERGLQDVRAGERGPVDYKGPRPPRTGIRFGKAKDFRR